MQVCHQYFCLIHLRHEQSDFYNQCIILHTHSPSLHLVLIPAACPHQVLNFTSSIKVAMDFVSPENAWKCFRLAGEFRQLERDHRRCVDILGLDIVLLHVYSTFMQMTPPDHHDPTERTNSDASPNNDSSTDNDPNNASTDTPHADPSPPPL